MTPAAATQLVVTAGPPGIVGVGSPFGLVVAAEDPFGNVDASFSGDATVSLSNNPGGATLGGTLTATAHDGVATFSGLTLNQPGDGYVLQASTLGLASGNSRDLDVRVSNVPTIFTVNLTSSSGAGSGNAGDLVYVIGLANANSNPGGSEIEFDPTVFSSPQTITLSSTLVLSETAGPEVIDGPGAGLVTVSGNDAVEVLSVSSGVTASLLGVTIARGSADVSGGGIYNSGTLTLSDASITDNWVSTGAFGGLGGGGGGLYNAGTMTVTDSAFDNNFTPNEGWGGGLYSTGTMTVADCTFDNNWAWYGGGLDNLGTMTVTGSAADNDLARSAGGVLNDGGTLTVANSTIADNSTSANGGGIGTGGTAIVANCTIAGNLAPYGGGGAQVNSGTLILTNCTIAYNSAIAPAGGGLQVTGGTAVSNNTIVALNTGHDIYGGVSGAYNVIGTGGSGGLVNGTSGNQVGVADPGLGPLGDYGGPTQTIALLPGCPAIDAGSNALAVDPQGNPLITDQRGFPRIVNGTVDIGAFESSGFVLSPSSGSGQSTLLNTAFGAALVVQVTANNPGEPVQGGQINFTAPASGASANLSPANPVTIAADGTASVTATANGIAGSYEVTATTAGATSPAVFDLTNATSTNAPVVTLQPVNQTVNAGATASFTATATGNPTPTVQWQVSTDGGVTFSDISGATADTYSFTAAADQNGDEYSAVFTNSYGSTTSAAATLTVNTAPVVTGNPSNQTVTAGNTATFTAAASGQPVPAVQWQVSTDGGTTFNNISGANADTYSFTAAADQNGNEYCAVFTNSLGSATSTAATLTVNTGPVVTTNPSDQTVDAGQSATFTAAASGQPAPTVQWQMSTDGGATFTDISGATANTYSFTALAAQNGDEYQAVFTNSVGSAATSAAILTVNTAPVVTTNPSNQTVTAGNTATFTAAASGQPAPTVQWQVSTDGGTTFNNISGANADTYSFTAAADQNGNEYLPSSPIRSVPRRPPRRCLPSCNR